MTQGFPELSFIDRSSPELQIVNEPDLNLEEMLSRIGLSDMGVTSSTDRNEVIQRQGVFELLHKNPSFARWIERYSESDDFCSDISTRPELFLKELHPKTKCGSESLDSLKEGLNILNKSGELPVRLTTFRDFITNTFEDQSRDEKLLSDTVSKEVLKATKFWGSVEVVVGYRQMIRFGEFKGGGFRLYGYDANKGKKWHFSENIRFLPVVGRVFEFAERIQNNFVDWRRYGPQRLDSDQILAGDLKRLFEQEFQKALPKIEDWQRIWSDSISKEDSIKFRVYFHYANGSLLIRVVDVHVNKGKHTNNWLRLKKRLPTVEDQFAGYNFFERRRMNKLKQELNSSVLFTGYSKIGEMHIHGALIKNKAMMRLLGDGISINDDGLVDKFGGIDTIPGFFNPTTHYNVVKLHSRINLYRRWVRKQVEELAYMSQVVGQMEKKRKQWKLPLTFPTVLAEDSHEIAIRSIYPISLIGRNDHNGKVIGSKQLVPINGLPKLNGVPVGLTGQNAGGKTVSAEEIAWIVWLAQAGLPIFGKGFGLNPKRVLAPVFIERGDGSTAQLLVRKLERVMKVVEANEPHHVLAIIDELGGATGHDDGTRLGMRVLTKLRDSGCSVMFNTQISGVAAFARDELGAHIFQVDLNHKIVLGIGKSNLDAIIAAEGLGLMLPSIQDVPGDNVTLH